MKPKCTADWCFIETPPKTAGKYLIGNTRSGDIGQARWAPRLKRWVFPSAHASFIPDVWTNLPKLPEAPKSHES